MILGLLFGALGMLIMFGYRLFFDYHLNEERIKASFKLIDDQEATDPRD